MYQYRLSFDLPKSKEPEDKFHPTNHPYGEHAAGPGVYGVYSGVGCAQCGRLEEEHQIEFWIHSSKKE